MDARPGPSSGQTSSDDAIPGPSGTSNINNAQPGPAGRRDERAERGIADVLSAIESQLVAMRHDQPELAEYVRSPPTTTSTSSCSRRFNTVGQGREKTFYPYPVV